MFRRRLHRDKQRIWLRSASVVSSSTRFETMPSHPDSLSHKLLFVPLRFCYSLSLLLRNVRYFNFLNQVYRTFPAQRTKTKIYLKVTIQFISPHLTKWNDCNEIRWTTKCDLPIPFQPSQDSNLNSFIHMQFNSRNFCTHL